jgi:aminopeptidase
MMTKDRGVSAEFAARLQRYADVIVRVGLNLRAGQRVLLTEPFELQGVSREATELVDAVRAAAGRAGAADVDVIWGNEARWRAAANGDGDGEREFLRELARNGERMRDHARAGGALVFLSSGHPGLMNGIPANRVAALREAGWAAYARVAPDLIAGRTNWTTAPTPTRAWARGVFAEASESVALTQLWEVVLAALRVDAADPVAAWAEHLDQLEQTRLALNERRLATVRWVGEGTDLVVAPARAHRWCTARLRTPDGRPFVANLPTEEIFTAPDRDSAEGFVRVARPVPYGGGEIAAMELEFRRGRVVQARARVGSELLQRLLATDRGAARLGEIAVVPVRRAELAAKERCFQQVLLDENAFDHIALGEAYPFSVGPGGAASLNHSLIHLDLPIDAQVEFIDAERR